MKNSSTTFQKLVDTDYDPETSIVLRYRNAFKSELTDEEDSKYKEWLKKTSIREGARIFPFMEHGGVEIHILDETSLMHTKTIKSIDGCVTTAKCKLRNYDRVVFESGGNTGTALTEYGRRAGIETFLFIPEENLPLLSSKTFESESTHLISVEEPGSVKTAAHLFETLNGLKHIPQTDWRYEASKYRGFFILEYMIINKKFDWITQTISAAFGPIGIYGVLENFKEKIGNVPRFLGVQQEVNSPMYKAWKSNKTIIESIEIDSTEKLLSKVMYDVKPHTYGTYKDLTDILATSEGDLTTISHSDFNDFLEKNFDGKNILQLLRENRVEIRLKNREVVEKSGLISLAGTIKEIDSGKISQGTRVLCSITGGASEADGRAKPEFRIPNLDSIVKNYSKIVFEGNFDG